MARKSSYIPYLLVLTLAALVPAALTAQDEGTLTGAQLRADCNEMTLEVRGGLREDPGNGPDGAPGLGGLSALVEYEITFTPGMGADPPLVFSGLFLVTSDDDGLFRQQELIVYDEPLCGWLDITGSVDLVGFDFMEIDVVDPNDGSLDCCDGSLGDFVWDDANGNGIQDDGETGIEGVRVTLFRAEDGMSRETVTDADGFYEFSPLCPGEYEVDVDESTLPDGFSATEPNVGDDEKDSDQPLDGSAVDVMLHSGQVSDCSDPTTDFGFVMSAVCSGAIGDFVWEDLNDDGVQDDGEPGIGDVVLILSDADGMLLATRTTDGAGGYLFGELCAGDYSVEYDPATVPAGLAPTLVDHADDDELDSDPSPVAVVLDADDSEDLTVDYGFGDCGPCDGKATSLSLRYDGAMSAFVEVQQKKNGEYVFADIVDPGEVFTFDGTEKEDTLGTEIKLFIDGELDVQIHTSCSQPLGPGLVFGSFTVISGTSRDNGLMCPLEACAVEADGSLEIKDEKVKWDITNVGDATVTIERITLEWPLDNGDLEKVKLEGDTLYETDSPPPSLVIDTFEGDLDERQIEDDKTATLEIEFDNDAAGMQDEYSIVVEFAEGCVVEFVPGQGGGDFDCDKPISQIVMIWDGGEAIDILAWKGEPGSELLADISGIVPGQEVAVSGYAGSPNDVFWEVFATGAGKLGESKYHLSCSDDDMDGAEDCGKRQGNGKGDDDGLVNDWLLEGMTDQSGAFDCTP